MPQPPTFTPPASRSVARAPGAVRPRRPLSGARAPPRSCPRPRLRCLPGRGTSAFRGGAHAGRPSAAPCKAEPPRVIPFDVLAEAGICVESNSGPPRRRPFWVVFLGFFVFQNGSLQPRTSVRSVPGDAERKQAFQLLQLQVTGRAAGPGERGPRGVSRGRGGAGRRRAGWGSDPGSAT